MLFLATCFIVVICSRVDGSKRMLMDDDSVYDILHRHEQLIAALNTTILGLQTSLQEEIKEKCQSGVTQFHKIECSSTACEEVLPVHFNPAFKATPVVTYGVQEMDSERGMNVRYSISAQSLTASGMDLKVGTWADTRLYSIGVSWIACPP